MKTYTTKAVRRRALREVRKMLRGVKTFVSGRSGPYRAFVPESVPTIVRAMLRTGRLPNARQSRLMLAAVAEARAS